jgi:ribonuclease BN (tRNA processing enzyme)
MRHGYNLAVGYRIVERRHRLREAYRDLPGPQIAQLVRQQGRDAVHEYYAHVELAYCGDGMAVDPALVTGARLLVHEATFLAADDRRNESHATLAEALAAARAAKIGALLLFHVSGRYTTDQFTEALAAELAAGPVDFPIYAILPRGPRRIACVHQPDKTHG